MIDTAKASPYRFVIGGLTLWAHFVIGANFQNVSPLLPLISDDYEISHATAGLLVGVVVVVHAVLGIPGGILVGRLGLWRTYTLSWLLMGLLTLSVLSPGFGGLLALRAAYGIGAGAMILASGPLVMQWFRPKELGVITSLNLASLTLGMTASISSAASLSELIDWQKALGLFGGLGFVGALLWMIWGRTLEGVGEPVTPLTFRQIKAVLGNRTLLLLGAADAACVAQLIVLSGWLPTFYHETRGMSLSEAGLITSILPFMGIFGVLLGGFLPLRFGSRRHYLIVPGAMAGIGGLGSFLIDNTTVTFLSLMLLGMGSWLYTPTLLTLPMELPGMTPHRVAIAWGWITTTSGISAFIAPIVVGAIRDTLDTFIPGFLLFSVLAWFLFIAGFLLPKTSPKSAEPPEHRHSDTPVPE